MYLSISAQTDKLLGYLCHHDFSSLLHRTKFMSVLSVCVVCYAQSCPTLCDPMDCTLLCPWNFPGKNTGAGCHFLHKRIFLTQGLNLCLWCLLNWQSDSLPLASPGKPVCLSTPIYYVSPTRFLSMRLCMHVCVYMCSNLYYVESQHTKKYPDSAYEPPSAQHAASTTNSWPI